jgi:hypothetical protein
MSKPADYGLPYPFRADDETPYLNVQIGPGEYVRVVTAGAYQQMLNSADDFIRAAETTAEQLRFDLNRLGVEYAALEAEHRRVTMAAYEQIKAAQDLIDVWRHYGTGNEGT